MNRRVLVGGLLALALSAGAAAAQSRFDMVVRQLGAQGYAEITVSQTLLGRTRIVARRGDERREIILNPRTGEILRDYWEGPSSAASEAGPSLLDPHDDDEEGEDDDDDGGDDGDDDGGDDDSGDDSGDGGDDD